MPAAAASTGATVAGRRRRHPVIGAVARVVRGISTAIWVVANKLLLLSVILALLKWRDWRIVVALLVATVGSTGVGYGATAVIVWLDPDDDD